MCVREPKPCVSEEAYDSVFQRWSNRDAKDAATIIVYRERAELEIFMVKRNARSKFMANAMVFPAADLNRMIKTAGGVRSSTPSQTIATRMDEDELAARAR